MKDFAADIRKRLSPKVLPDVYAVIAGDFRLIRNAGKAGVEARGGCGRRMLRENDSLVILPFPSLCYSVQL
jgi:hypothetical protein